jgi:ABC-type amino acid transport substrate-binding protein
VLTFVIVRPDPPERSKPVEISTAEWLPYISPDLPDGGPVAKMLTDVFGRAGYTADFTFSTWPVAEKDVRSGATVGMAPVIVSPTRADFSIYSDPLLDFRYTLFGRQGETLDSLSQRDDLSGITVARIEGYQYWDELNESGATFIDRPSAASAFEAVMDGDADVVAEGSVAGNAVLNGPDFPDDASDYAEVDPASPLTSSTQGLHLLIKDTPEGRELQKEFNKSLKEYTATEDYQNVLASLEGSPDQVLLTAGTGGAIELFDDDGAKAGVTPSGTKATVLSWPEGTTEKTSLVKLKLLAGPMSGRVVHARLEDLEMNDDDA